MDNQDISNVASSCEREVKNRVEAIKRMAATLAGYANKVASGELDADPSSVAHWVRVIAGDAEQMADMAAQVVGIEQARWFIAREMA